MEALNLGTALNLIGDDMDSLRMVYCMQLYVFMQIKVSIVPTVTQSHTGLQDRPIENSQTNKHPLR